MPSERIARQIEKSLAPGESVEDFRCLFDALMLLRRPYHKDSETSEIVTAKILCILFPDKQDKSEYVSAMQQFRTGFKNVSKDIELQAEFWNCIKTAAIALSKPEDVVWRPSLYFTLSRTLHEGLKGWF